MTAADLAASAKCDASPPAGLSPEAEALWHAKKGNWHEAHEIAQDIPTPMGAWIHALLHLIEGDTGNAGYWYRQAGQTVAKDSLEAEWLRIAAALGGGERK